MHFVVFLLSAALLLPFSNPNIADTWNPVFALSDTDAVQGESDAETSEQSELIKTEAQPGQLLIKFKEKVKKSAIDKLNEKIGAIILEEHEDNLYLLEIPSKHNLEDALSFYKKNKKVVEYVEPNFIRLKAISPNDPGYPSLWNFDNTGQTGGTVGADIDAPEAWNTVTDCSAVVVAIIDDGLDYTHEDLKNNVWINEIEASGIDGIDDDGNGYIDDVIGYDFGNNDNDPFPDVGTDKSAGHGTHVAGIIGAEGNNGVGITGVCWNVQLLPLKIYNKSGKTTVNEVIEAINYIVWLKTNANVNIKVVNMSFGGKAPSNAEFEALKNLRDAGVLATAAAGNTGTSTKVFSIYPASYPLDNIISVAASNNKDQIASFSTFGPDDVDIAAPGSSILSTFLDDSYVTMSGTSMAAPHVAGVAALLAASDDSLDYNEIRSKIFLGADKKLGMKTKVGTSARLNAYGALIVDSSLPDFAITSFEVPESAKLGSDVTVKLTISNQGGSYADKTSVKIFASGDPQDLVEPQSAFLVGKITVSPLGPGKEVKVSGKISLPEIPQTVYLVAVIDYDNLVSEFDESNNQSGQAQISILSNVDLRLTSLHVPDKIKAGKDVDISFSVKNKSNSDVGEVLVGLYLSKDKKFDASDLELAQYTLTDSDIQKTKSKKTLGILDDISKGKYYIIAYVDPQNDIPETNENNNIKVRPVKIT